MVAKLLMSLFELRKVESSAYNIVLELIENGKFIINGRKSKGTRTEHCGTPYFTFYCKV